MHKNLFISGEIRKERKNNIANDSDTSPNENSVLTNIRTESDTAVTELNEKIPQEEVEDKKKNIKNQFKKIQRLCNSFGYDEEIKRIPRIVVKNIYIDSYNISKKLDFLPISNNQSVKDAAIKSRENGINEPINESINKNDSPITLVNVDERLEQLEQTNNNDPEVSKMRNPVQTFLKNLVNNNSFCMRVPESKNIFESIRAEHFKNQFETHNSKGAFDPKGRKFMTRLLFGVDENTVANMAGKEFEKYGYLDSPDVKSGPTFYGKIKVIFKKKSLLNRVTLTVGDSLNRTCRGRGGVVASRVINPKIESIQGVVGGNYSYLNAMYDLIRKNKINPKMNPMDITGKLEMQNNNNIINSKTQKDSDTNSVEYFELQYHGKLTMNDVESFQIPGKKDIQLYDEEEEKVLKNIDDVKSVIGDKSISSKEFSKFASKSKSYDGDLGDYGDGEYRNAYLDMAKHDASTLTEDEAKAMDEYTNDPTKINAALKNGEFDHDDKEKDLKLIDLFRLKKIEKELEEKKELNKNITNMHLAFMKHKLPKDFVSYRGVTDDMLIYLLGMRGFDKEQSESILNESGHINHDELYKRGKYKLLEGLEFEDKTFVSTSTNELFARRRSNEEVNRANAKALAAKRDAKSKKEAAQMVEETNVFKDVKGSHVMKIKIPKGTRAMFTDTMYKRGQDVHNQDELLLDAGYTYRVDKVKPMSVGRYCLEVSVIS